MTVNVKTRQLLREYIVSPSTVAKDAGERYWAILFILHIGYSQFVCLIRGLVSSVD